MGQCSLPCARGERRRRPVCFPYSDWRPVLRLSFRQPTRMITNKETNLRKWVNNPPTERTFIKYEKNEHLKSRNYYS